MAVTQHPSSPSTGVTITHHTVGRRMVLTVEGEIDIATVGLLAAAIDNAVEEGATELWVDLSPTLFMDSAGLHLLLDTRRRLAELNRRLAVICPAGCVRRLFKVAAVDRVLPLYDDRGAAHLAG